MARSKVISVAPSEEEWEASSASKRYQVDSTPCGKDEGIVRADPRYAQPKKLVKTFESLVSLLPWQSKPEIMPEEDKWLWRGVTYTLKDQYRVRAQYPSSAESDAEGGHGKQRRKSTQGGPAMGKAKMPRPSISLVKPAAPTNSVNLMDLPLDDWTELPPTPRTTLPPDHRTTLSATPAATCVATEVAGSTWPTVTIKAADLIDQPHSLALVPAASVQKRPVPTCTQSRAGTTDILDEAIHAVDLNFPPTVVAPRLNESWDSDISLHKLFRENALPVGGGGAFFAQPFVSITALPTRDPGMDVELTPRIEEVTVGAHDTVKNPSGPEHFRTLGLGPVLPPTLPAKKEPVVDLTIQDSETELAPVAPVTVQRPPSPQVSLISEAPSANHSVPEEELDESMASDETEETSATPQPPVLDPPVEHRTDPQASAELSNGQRMFLQAVDWLRTTAARQEAAVQERQAVSSAVPMVSRHDLLDRIDAEVAYEDHLGDQAEEELLSIEREEAELLRAMRERKVRVKDRRKAHRARRSPFVLSAALRRDCDRLLYPLFIMSAV